MPGNAQKPVYLAAKPRSFTTVVKGVVTGKVRAFKDMRRIVRNWPEVALFRLGLRNRVVAKWRSGGSVAVNSPDEWADLKLGCLWDLELLKACGRMIKDDEIQLSFRGKPLHFQTGRMFGASFVLREQFVEEAYKWLRVEGKQVVDVGANIGDTAIYFALGGAAHVYALEPYPYSYRLAKRNVELNCLEKQVTLLNMGCGNEGTITVSPEFKNNPGSELTECEGGRRYLSSRSNELWIVTGSVMP